MCIQGSDERIILAKLGVDKGGCSGRGSFKIRLKSIINMKQMRERLEM